MKDIKNWIVSIINNMIDRFIEVECQILLYLVEFDPFYQLYMNFCLQNFEKKKSKTFMQWLWSRWRKFLQFWVAKIFDLLKKNFLANPQDFSILIFFFFFFFYLFINLILDI